MAEEVVVSVESGVAVNAENANVTEGAEEFLEPEESQDTTGSTLSHCKESSSIHALQAVR